MRQIDVSSMVILCSGAEWTYEIPPCSKDAIGLLERNERLVTWLMPTGGSIKDQVAAIRYNGGYYSLSLRMMKAIYRHVRLYKDFVNVENVNGIQKQRIPELLLKEKIRTQSRFDAMRKLSCVASVSKKEGVKGGCTVASKMRVFIQDGLMELSEDIGSLPVCTYFSHSHPNVLEEFLYDFHADFPEIVEDKALFMAKMSEAHDAFLTGMWDVKGCRGMKRRRTGDESSGSGSASPSDGGSETSFGPDRSLVPHACGALIDCPQ